VKEFAAIHGERWKSQGYPSAFDDPAHIAFHTEVSRKIAHRGWLRMHFLRVKDTPIALCYAFNYKDRIYMYHSNAHGTEEMMKCSPGFLIRSLAMADGITEGMKVFDYLRGDEPYKYREYQGVDSKNYLLRVSSGTPTGRVRFFAFLMFELAGKGISRTQREFYEYKRFTITEKRSPADRIGYVTRRAGELGLLAYNYIMRHAPTKSLRKFQIHKNVPGNSTAE
jgi:hypothetical protein